MHLYLRCYGRYQNPRLVFPSTTVIFPSPVNHEKVIVQYPVRKELQQLDIVMNCWRAVTLVWPIEQSALLCGEDSHALLELKVFGFPLHGNRRQPRAGESAHSCYKRGDFTQERRSIQAIRLPVGRVTPSVALADCPLLLDRYVNYYSLSLEVVSFLVQ